MRNLTDILNMTEAGTLPPVFSNASLKGAPVLGSDGRRGTITKLSRPWVRIDWLPTESASDPVLSPNRSQAFLRGDPALVGIQVLMGQNGGRPLAHIAGSKRLRAECACEQNDMRARVPLMRVKESGRFVVEGGNPFVNRDSVGPSIRGVARAETGDWKCHKKGDNQSCEKQTNPGRGRVITVRPWVGKDEYNKEYYDKVVKPRREAEKQAKKK